MAELGLTIAFSDHQEEPEDELIIPAAHHVATIAITVFYDAPCSSNTIFAFCHAIARQVFIYQQSRVLSRKESELGNQPSEMLRWRDYWSGRKWGVVVPSLCCSATSNAPCVLKSASKRVQTKIKSNVRSSSLNIWQWIMMRSKCICLHLYSVPKEVAVFFRSGSCFHSYRRQQPTSKVKWMKLTLSAMENISLKSQRWNFTIIRYTKWSHHAGSTGMDPVPKDIIKTCISELV